MMKVLSFNVHKGVGWAGKSTLNKIRDQIRELHPDLIFLQEICGSQFEFLAHEIWPYHSYGKNVHKAETHYGNAILSKYPITFNKNTDISANLMEKRGMLHAIIHPDNANQQIHLLCTHLSLFKRSRHKQFLEIIRYIQTHLPINSPLILGGDFNDWASHATEHMIERLGLEECFLNHHGEYAKTFPAWRPILKLDRIYSRGFETCAAERLTQKHWKTLSDHIGLNVHLKFNF